MADVRIRSSIDIQCGEGKWIHVPPTLLEEHQGQQFLRLRPSSHPIVALVTEHCEAKCILYKQQQAARVAEDEE